jgi:hypothetical protein
MKKSLLAAGIAMLLTMPTMAAEPTTLVDRADRLDEVVYGEVKEGSFNERIDELDKTIYGTTDVNSTDGLDVRISSLYADVLSNDNDEQPALSTRVNTLEYFLTDEIKQDSLTSRVDTLDSTVFGKPQTGGIGQRVTSLEQSVYGDNHYELSTVTLPANTVFKISLNEDVSSKTNLAGDPVHFTVEEDVKVDDVLVLPRGAQGSGVITKVTRPKFFGRSGSLEISFDQVFSIDDESIPTVLGPEAKEQIKMQAAAVGASAIGALALGPIGLVGGFFVKGKDVEMPAGTELYIQTKEDVVTKGMKMKEGAAPAFKRTRTVSPTMVADENETDVPETVDEAEDTATTAADKVETAADEAETAAQEEKDKAEAEVKETADTAEQASDEAASVVIVRHE